MPALAAIQYSRLSFDPGAGGEVMGRRVAGQTFLEAWLRHSGATTVCGFVHSADDGEGFRTQAVRLGWSGAIEVAGPEQLRPVADAGALWLADPRLAPRAWERRWIDQRAWSLIGITHTISTARAMDSITELATAPVQAWDALVCTSRAVRRVVETMLGEQEDYLDARLGATLRERPELPVIPLGVDCETLAADPRDRARWREQLGIADGDVAVLHFGRLSFHLKAHPLPLMEALKLAAAHGGPRLHMIFAGQPTNKGQDEMFRQLAEAYAEYVTVHFVDGALSDAGTVRAAADIFTLLSDNLQESFGLAPVEAMAAGLPVVGSDWDGLRDTIEHGVTGFLVDTLMPPPGAGDRIARRFAAELDDYHHYLAEVAQAVSVDVGQAAQAFATLAADPDLRRCMGEAGRRRARALFDWPVVIGAYRGLLDQLAEIRRTAPERAARAAGRAAEPARMDPYAAFAGYPTARLASDLPLRRRAGAPASIKGLPGDRGVMIPMAITSIKAMDALLGAFDPGPLTVSQLHAAHPEIEVRGLFGIVAWMLKTGLIERAR